MRLFESSLYLSLIFDSVIFFFFLERESLIIQRLVLASLLDQSSHRFKILTLKIINMFKVYEYDCLILNSIHLMRNLLSMLTWHENRMFVVTAEPEADIRASYVSTFHDDTVTVVSVSFSSFTDLSNTTPLPFAVNIESILNFQAFACLWAPATFHRLISLARLQPRSLLAFPRVEFHPSPPYSLFRIQCCSRRLHFSFQKSRDYLYLWWTNNFYYALDLFKHKSTKNRTHGRSQRFTRSVILMIMWFSLAIQKYVPPRRSQPRFLFGFIRGSLTEA